MQLLRSRKFWIGLGVVLVGLELIWVVGANWALSSEWVTGKINNKPEKLEVRWGRARTWIPGIIELDGLSVRGQSRKQQWFVELQGGAVHMSLLSLASKTFRTYSFEGAGLDFRLRKRELPGEGPLKTAEFAPEIPGLAVDEPPFPPKKQKRKRKKPWTIALNDIHIDGLDQLWILALRLTAEESSIDADLEIELGGGPLSLDRVRMDLTNAELSAMGDSFMREMQLGIDAHMDPFLPKEMKGLEVVKSLSGTVTLSGHVKGAGLVNSLLAKIESVEVGGPGGKLEGRVEIGRGVLQPGTDLAWSTEEGWVDVMDWRAEGRLAIESEVEQGEETSSKVRLTLADVEVSEASGSQPILTGADLTLNFEAGELDVSGGVESLSEALETVYIDLVNAYVADITRVPIPAAGDFRLVGGEILVESHAVLTHDEGGEAKLKVHGDDIDAAYGEVAIQGDLSLDLQVSTDDVSDRRFDFGESSLRIDMVRIEDGKKTEENWYFHLDMTDGWVSMKEPREIVCSAELSMKDTRPLIAILGQQKKIFNRLKGILNFKDVEGEADVELAAHRLEIENFDIDSEGLKLKANLQILDKESSGILYTKFHGIAIALDLRDEKRDWVLHKPLQWYEQQTVPWAGRPQM